MAVLTVTKGVGGTAKPVAGLYVPPETSVPDAGSGTGLDETGLDSAFMADLLSACLAHERCGVHLYRSVAARSTVEELRSHYEDFGAETLRHVEILEELITASGGNPNYVSLPARAAEKAAAGLLESTFMLDGSLDPVTAELAMLEAVLLAETKDYGNWYLLRQLADAMGESAVKDALTAAAEVVLAEEEEHYGWADGARGRMLYGLATAGQELPSAIDLAGASKEELYAKAQELEIQGRSDMTKDELAAAIEEKA